MFRDREPGLRNLPIRRGSREQFEDGHEDRDAIAVSMQSVVTLALTLTLSPRRGNFKWPRRKNSLNGKPIPALEKVPPLPGGEGRGEGEGESQLNSYGFA